MISGCIPIYLYKLETINMTYALVAEKGFHWTYGEFIFDNIKHVFGVDDAAKYTLLDRNYNVIKDVNNKDYLMVYN